MNHYDNLNAEDHSLRMHAIQIIMHEIWDAINKNELLEICQKIDEYYIETTDTWPRIKTPEVFFLRVA